MNRKRVEELLARHGVAYPPCGVWVEDGWLPILDDALGRMVAAGWNRDLHQVKEKFGGLRTYVGDADARIEEIIEEAQARAARTCEFCGDPGSLRNFDGTVLTRCSPCELRERQERGA